MHTQEMFRALTALDQVYQRLSSIITLAHEGQYKIGMEDARDVVGAVLLSYGQVPVDLSEEEWQLIRVVAREKNSEL